MNIAWISLIVLFVLFIIIFIAVCIINSKKAKKNMEKTLEGLFENNIPNMSEEEQKNKAKCIMCCPSCGARMELMPDNKWHCPYCQAKMK